MISFDSLPTFIIATVVLACVPGPDNIFVITQSALHGRRAGILITLGLCTGLVVHTFAVALGLATVFMVSSIAFNLLKIIGAAYLLYLAWQAFKSSSDISIQEQPPIPLSNLKLYQRGVIMNLTNPKIAVFFLAFLPQFVDPNVNHISLQLITLGIVFILIALLSFSLFAITASLIADSLKRSSKAQAMMNKIAALVFVALAVRLVTSSR